MILSLIAALFVLLIAAFWAFQGVFSSAIMLLETIAAVMIAFGFYEPLAGVLADKIPEYHAAVALVLIFVVTLVVLRVLTDKYIGTGMQFPMIVDRAGGGLLGLLTGLLVIGVALIGIQMLPVGPELLGFQRISPAAPKVRHSVWLNPDGFTVGIVNLLSAPGRFSGGGSFGDARPAFLDDLAAANLGAAVNSRRDVPLQALAARNYWLVDSIDEVMQQPEGDKWKREFKKVQPDDPAHRYLVVRVGLDTGAADFPEEGGSLRMARFTPAQFRIVGREADGGAADWRMASGLSDIFSEKVGFKLDKYRAQRVVRWPLDQPFGLGTDNAVELVKDGKFVLDVAFEVPADFKPKFIEFKSGARAELNEKMALAKPPVAEKAPPPKPAAKPKKASDDEEEDEEGEEGNEKPAAGSEKKSTKKPAADADDDESESGETKPDDEDDDAAEKPKVKVGEKPAGRTGVAAAVEEKTGVSAKLPMPLKKSGFPSASLQGGKFKEGHVVFEPAEAGAKPADSVVEFVVPEGQRVVQVGAEAVFAGSMLGQVLEYAKRAVSQISIESDSGERFFAIGVYTAATIGGKRVLEIQYWPEADVPERCLEPARKLTPNVLRTAANQGDLKMGFVFLVPPGTKIVKFHSSPRNSQDVAIDVPK